MKLRSITLALLAACGADTESANIDRPSEACMDRAPNAFRVRFEGSGFTSFEALGVEAVTSIGLVDGSSISCRAATRTTVVNGAFTALVDNRSDDAAYPLLGAFIDVDGDSACSADVDLVWVIVSIIGPADAIDVQPLTPQGFARRADAEGCARLR